MVQLLCQNFCPIIPFWSVISLIRVKQFNPQINSKKMVNSILRYVVDKHNLATAVNYSKGGQLSYSTKHSRTKTFVVRSPCEYISAEKLSCFHQNSIHKCQNTLKFMGKHSWSKQKLRKPQMFWPSNVLYYTV